LLRQAIFRESQSSPFRLDELTPGNLALALERFGSVRIASRVCRWPQSQIRKRAEEWGIKISECLDYGQGNSNTARGRKGELAFASLRGDLILEDTNVAGNATADWDFIDAHLGKVNVKSSKLYRKSGRHQWQFSLSGIEKCEHVAFLAMNMVMSKVIFWFYMPVPALAKYGVTTMTVREELSTSLRKTKKGFVPATARAVHLHTSLGPDARRLRKKLKAKK
jgi:hypothetical protein